MLARIFFVVSIFFGATDIAVAETYRILVPGGPFQAPAKAAKDFMERLEGEPTGAELDPWPPGIFPPSEFLEILELGEADFALLPFEAMPELGNSALLEPFLAQDATSVRQAIDSEVGAIEMAELEALGYRVLDIWHVSSTIFASKRPVLEVQDLNGIKFRTPSTDQAKTLAFLGATPVPMPAGDLLAALSRGSIDSSALPIGHRNVGAGLLEVVSNYVDRLYRPQLYAVIVKSSRWDALPFPDQHYLAKSAQTVGAALVGPLNVQAAEFRDEELARGSRFNAWSEADLQQVRLASLAVVAGDNPEIDRELVSLAYARAAADPAPVSAGEPRPLGKVRLLFATDRMSADLSRPETAFSSMGILRGHSFGAATVSLDERRRFGSNLKKVAMIERIDLRSEDQFIKEITTQDGKDVVVFVHGYNNGFTDSIRRGATIQEDIAPGAVVISYTWPSDGELLSYAYDENSTDTALQNFKLFMDMLTEFVPSNRIHIIAHSMGSRLVVKYVANLPERGKRPDDIKFSNIIFAAADISTRFFQQKQEEPFDLDFPLSVYADRITVYSSENDMPLNFSRKIHGDLRLGLADQSSIYLEADIIAIDASLIDPAKFYHAITFATRHSYVFDKAAGVQDLSLLLSGAEADARPGMTRMSRDGHKYWVLSP